MRITTKAGLIATLPVTLLAATSLAQTAPGFSVPRLAPADAGSRWFSGDSLDLRGHRRVGASLVLDYAHRPLVVRNAGNIDTAPVEHQLLAHVGAAITLADRLRLAVSVPLALVDTGEAGTSGGLVYQAEAGPALGDVRLGATVGLFGVDRAESPVRVAVGVQVFAPTGHRAGFLSDGKLRYAPHVSVAGEVGAFVYAGQAAFVGRVQEESDGGDPLGNSVRIAASAGVRVAGGDLLIGPELYGETSLAGGKAFESATTPLEALLGAHYAVTDGWNVGLGAGRGLTGAIGSPDARALASLTFFMPPPRAAVPPPPPPPPPAPRPRPRPPADSDQDGVPDTHDACPDVSGLRALEGCPDRDGDEIADKTDACPTEAGPSNDDPAKNGCPPPRDDDKDGIPNEADACPDAAGVADPDAKKNGCPKVAIVAGEIKILERIEFENGKATLRPESEPLLEAIRRALAEHSEIKKVRLEGYTDDRGKAATNLKLSQARVDAVKDWLVAHGIAADRLVAQGFGKKNPIADNKTEDGRQRNRRVQLIILEQAPAPTN